MVGIRITTQDLLSSSVLQLGLWRIRSGEREICLFQSRMRIMVGFKKFYFIDKAWDCVKMAAVKMWLDSGKLTEDLIPLYKVCFNYQIDISITFQGKIGQVRGSQDDIRIWPWTTSKEYGHYKDLPPGAGKGLRVGCPKSAIILFLGSPTDLGSVVKPSPWQTSPGK